MELIATKRTELGKKSKKLRTQGLIPGVVFAKGMESLPLKLTYKEFEKVFKAAGESTLVDLKVENDTPFKVLISEVEVHPVTSKIVHANLHKVNLKEKINATVPLEIVGESPVVKSGEGLLLTLIDELNIEVLPADLPHHITVDVSGLTAIEQGIHIKDLSIDLDKIKVIGHTPEDLVVKVDYAEMKEEEAVVEPVSEAELISKVEATSQLSEEEKAKKEAEKKAEKEKAAKE